jgi:hypothetical protein
MLFQYLFKQTDSGDIERVVVPVSDRQTKQVRQAQMEA